MSPHDRFTVGSLTGWKINPAKAHMRKDSAPRPTTVWYVHDRAYGFAIVREFIGGYAEGHARRLAKRLNNEREEHLRSNP